MVVGLFSIGQPSLPNWHVEVHRLQQNQVTSYKSMLVFFLSVKSCGSVNHLKLNIDCEQSLLCSKIRGKERKTSQRAVRVKGRLLAV